MPMSLIQNLIAFISASPTPWHAVAEASQALSAAGFTELKEGEAWVLQPGGKYFVVRLGTSLCAFVMPLARQPLSCRIVAGHTDSPGFKLRPNAEYRKDKMVMLGLEVYGGPLLTSWLNRDLGIAGKVVCKHKGQIKEVLVRLEDMPIVIPQLAIHLDRQVNESGLTLNKQDHLAALAGVEARDDKPGYLDESLKKHVQGDILAKDLFVYPLEEPRLIGHEKSLASGYRLDNLCGVQAALEGLLAGASKPSEDMVKMAVLWDHEEIGSDTAQGAGSPFLSQVMERIAGSREAYFKMLSSSLCVSIDMAHGLHPNYPEKHEPRHQVFLNRGIIIKHSAQYRYATNATTQAFIQDRCHAKHLPVQHFSTRGDIPAGTTIGPIAAHCLGIPTVDIGIAQLSMHSCREIIGVKDYDDLVILTQALLS
jgi:aspartyl aminopeptidase